jgi:hypothetical protein
VADTAHVRMAPTAIKRRLNPSVTLSSNGNGK